MASAAAAPQPPHEVYGTVTDNGVQAQGVTVEAVSSGNVIVSDTTDSNGYYELKVPSNYSSFDLVVSGTTENQSISVQSGRIQEIDVSGDYISDNGGNGLSVSVPDEAVEEGSSVQVSPTVSDAGSSPSYSWSIVGDNHGATLTGENQRTVTFQAPDDVSGDVDVSLKLTVTKSGGSSKSATGTVTVLNTTEQQPGGGAGTGEGTGQGQQGQAPEPKQVQAQTQNGKSIAQIQGVKANQQVQVTIPETPSQDGANPVEQVSLSSSTDAESVSVTVDDLGTDRPETVSEDAGAEVYSYQQISVEGVEDRNIQESTINFRVQKSFLDEKGRSPEDVVMKRYHNSEWQSLDTRVSEELDNAYRFKASSTGFSYYAIALQEQQNQTQGEPNIQTTSLSVQPSEGTPPFDVTIDVTVKNSGNAEGSKAVKVKLGDEVIRSETVSLEAGEERTLSYNYTVEQSGSLSFSAGNQSTTVEASQKGTSVLPVAVALLIAAILAVVGYTQREVIQSKIEELRE
ncbi:MAG: PGF-pre-PGF domain-containing protein [Candidatus Nanohalobium sp.]